MNINENRSFQPGGSINEYKAHLQQKFGIEPQNSLTNIYEQLILRYKVCTEMYRCGGVYFESVIRDYPVIIDQLYLDKLGFSIIGGYYMLYSIGKSEIAEKYIPEDLMPRYKLE